MVKIEKKNPLKIISEWPLDFKLYRKDFGTSLYKIHVFMAIAPVSMFAIRQLQAAVDLWCQKLKFCIYCDVTANILTKLLQKWFLSV